MVKTGKKKKNVSDDPWKKIRVGGFPMFVSFRNFFFLNINTLTLFTNQNDINEEPTEMLKRAFFKNKGKIQYGNMPISLIVYINP